MDPTLTQTYGDLEHQLAALYEERELLASTIGVTDANQLISMIASMSDQLASLYSEREGSGDPKHGSRNAFREHVVPAAAALQEAMGKVEVTVEGRVDEMTWRLRCRPL